jgi:hypothetical protein
MIYRGLDLRKSFCPTKICTIEGELIKEGRIKTDTKDIEEFFSGLEDMKTKIIAEAKIKTDKIDAKTLAELRSGVFLPTSYVPPKAVRALRHLVRHRIFLDRYRGIIKNQIKIELRRSETKKCRNRDRESVFLRGLGSKGASVRKYELLWANNKRML